MGASLLVSVYVIGISLGYFKGAGQNAESTERFWLAICKEGFPALLPNIEL